jgi:hypothetical protein
VWSIHNIGATEEILAADLPRATQLKENSQDRGAKLRERECFDEQ